MKRNRILIVDDEPGIRESLSGVLEDEGFETAVAASGEECLETLEREGFDVALIDVWMPGIDGLEVLHRIEMRADPERPVVAMISGHGSIEAAVRATKTRRIRFSGKATDHRKSDGRGAQRHRAAPAAPGIA